MFKYKESSSITLPEVKVYVPEPHHEFRGEMWTFWEQSMDTPTEKISDPNE